jgi:hypothetical protein
VVPRIDAMAKELGVEIVYYVEFDYRSDLAAEYHENNTYDYGFGGTPLVVLFENGEYSYSNFSYLNPDSDRYEGAENYYEEVIEMFKSFH